MNEAELAAIKDTPKLYMAMIHRFRGVPKMGARKLAGSSAGWSLLQQPFNISIPFLAVLLVVVVILTVVVVVVVVVVVGFAVK